MNAIVALFIVALTGCAGGIEVQWVRATQEQIDRWCSPKANGCYKMIAGVCTVIAPDPPMMLKNGRHTYTSGQWGTLGHEIKHCFDGDFHD